MSWLSHEGDGCWEDCEQFTETRARRRLCEEPRSPVEEAGAGVPRGRPVSGAVRLSSKDKLCYIFAVEIINFSDQGNKVKALEKLVTRVCKLCLGFLSCFGINLLPL